LINSSFFEELGEIFSLQKYSLKARCSIQRKKKEKYIFFYFLKESIIRRKNKFEETFFGRFWAWR